MFKTVCRKAEEKAIRMGNFISSTKTQVKSFMRQKSGEGLFTDIIMALVIVAVVGAIVYGVIQLFFPNIITGVMEKVQEGIDGIDMFNGSN